jgi:hypothetical protein
VNVTIFRVTDTMVNSALDLIMVIVPAANVNATRNGKSPDIRPVNVELPMKPV